MSSSCSSIRLICHYFYRRDGTLPFWPPLAFMGHVTFRSFDQRKKKKKKSKHLGSPKFWFSTWPTHGKIPKAPNDPAVADAPLLELQVPRESWRCKRKKEKEKKKVEQWHENQINHNFTDSIPISMILDPPPQKTRIWYLLHESRRRPGFSFPQANIVRNGHDELVQVI